MFLVPRSGFVFRVPVQGSEFCVRGSWARGDACPGRPEHGTM